MDQPAVSVKNLNKSFGDAPVVRDVSFHLLPGQTIVLLGPSGCGKTTTLRLIAGFETLDSGVVQIDGKSVATANSHTPPEKRRIGMVFQDYAIFPHLDVKRNISFGLPRSVDRDRRVQEMLALVGMDRLGERMPHELSGGQQQRVALARALAPEPAVLLLDEPFSNLDAALRAELRAEVKQLLKNSATTAVFVTHDQEEALFMGDQITVMNNGRVEQIGSAEEVYHQPKTRFVAEFVGQTDFLSGQVAGQSIETPLGHVPLSKSVPENTPLEIMVRPDDVKLEADPNGNAQIVSREFQGIAYLYLVRLEDGSIVHSWQSHRVNFSPGSTVSASIRLGHSLTIFHNGFAI